MSIVTKKGDTGETDLLFGRRVSKNHFRIEANGYIDELNAAIGLVRVQLSHPNSESLHASFAKIQRTLIHLMGELATHPDDQTRYETAGFLSIDETALEHLTSETEAIERDLSHLFKTWAIPGEKANRAGAALDFARCVARRAERAVWAIHAQEPLANQLILPYLNRLSDWLWILARYVESEPPV